MRKSKKSILSKKREVIFLEIPKEKFLTEAKRIVDFCQERGVSVRLLGALAFYYHCPRYNYLQESLGRVFTDIDFAARSEDREKIRTIFKELNYQEDVQVNVLYGAGRLVFNHPSGLHSDVFLDCLDFCHTIHLKERLEADYPTIPLAELFLEKMQIVKINEKDIIDTVMLLREHEIGESDREVINAKHIARLCSRDWGLWKTITMNLAKVASRLQQYEKQLKPEDCEDVKQKALLIKKYIDDEPKSTGWKLRNRIGERVKWYKEVDELPHA